MLLILFKLILLAMFLLGAMAAFVEKDKDSLLGYLMLMWTSIITIVSMLVLDVW